jgi:peptide deformylase
LARRRGEPYDRAMATDPSKLSIVTYPEKVLRTSGKALKDINDEVRAVAARMIELMYEAEGIGLAAPQVGLSWQMFVLDVPDGEGRKATDDPPTCTTGPKVFINPKITKYDGAPEPFEEGCLSLPDIRGDVLRPPVVTMTATDEHGKSFTIRAGGLLARCVQHEFDHLHGVLILDKMTQTARMKNRTAVRDLERSR